MSFMCTPNRQAELFRFNASVDELNQKAKKHSEWMTEVAHDHIFDHMRNDIQTIHSYETQTMEIDRIKLNITHCKNMIAIQAMERVSMGA